MSSPSISKLSYTEAVNTTHVYLTELISDQMTWLITKILMFGMTPIISAFGVIGNIISIIILIKHGMSKSSNILLVVLAFSDIIYLVSFNSVPKIIYEAVWNHEYVGYSNSVCDVLFIFFSLFTLLDYTLGLLGLTLPMLITAERLIVIFLPLNFDRVVTPFRTWLVLVGVGLYWLSIFIYSSFWQVLHYEFNSFKNTSVCIFQRSDFFHENLEAVAAVENVSVYSSMVLPPVFTVTGCVVISVKLHNASKRRQKMTSKSRSNLRTTKTLLAVCAVYCVTAAVLSLPQYIPEYTSYSLTDGAPSNIGKISYQLLNIVVCINSSSNFIVYVCLNRQFRNTLKSILPRPLKLDSCPGLLHCYWASGRGL